MARGQTVTAIVIVNNMPKTTVTKTVEPIVINGQLVADNSDINPGVNSRTQ
jgi:tetrahydromethanopterin S-methyltransferase subunit F